MQPYQRGGASSGSRFRIAPRASRRRSLHALLAIAAAVGTITGLACAGEGGSGTDLLGTTTAAALLSVSPDWQAAYDEYEPDPRVLEAIESGLAASSGELRVEVILGTWCGDSRRQVPRLLKILDTLGQDRLPAAFVGVHREREKRGEAIAGKRIERIPTFIVYRKGEEIGRIVETPKATMEEDLAAILRPAFPRENP